MEITINTRHCKVPESLRNQAETRLLRLQRIDRNITSATVVFDGTALTRRVEARLAVAGGPPLIGHGTANSLRTALDDALGRLERQLKRRRDRISDRRQRGGTPARDLVTQ